MGVMLQQRQTRDCPSGYLWYVCAKGPFTGCCGSDPCNDGICPESDQPSATQTEIETTTTTTPKTTTPRTSTTPTPTARTTTARTTTARTTTPTPTPTPTTPTRTLTTDPTATASITEPSSTPAPDTITYTATISGSITTVTHTGTIIADQSPTSTALSAPNHTPPLGAIIGGVLGGILLLALLAFFLFRRQRKEHTAHPPYDSVLKKPSATTTITTFLTSLLPRRNHNSLASPPPPKHNFLASLLPFKKHNTEDPHRFDTKLPMSPVPGPTEMPSPSFAPHTLPYDRAELESDVTATAPSELSSVSTPLYHRGSSPGSGWSPTPDSYSSTGAVLSPVRETHYSETSSAAGGSAVGGGSAAAAAAAAAAGLGLGQQPNSSLRGGGWPGMRPTLGSLRRKQRQEQGEQRHVMSWMDYNDPGVGGSRGESRG